MGTRSAVVVAACLFAPSIAVADEPASDPSAPQAPARSFDHLYSILPSQAPTGHVDTPAEPSNDPHRLRRHTGIGLVIGGVGLIAVSNRVAKGIQNDVENGQITVSEGHHRMSIYADTVFWSGMVAAAVGTTLWLTSRKPARTQVGIVPIRGGSALAMSGRF